MPRMTATAYDKATATESKAHREAEAAWKAAEHHQRWVADADDPASMAAAEAAADAAWQNMQDAREDLRAARRAALAAHNS